MTPWLTLVGDDYIHFLLLLTAVLLLIFAGRCQPSTRAFALMTLPVALLLTGFYWKPAMGVVDVYNPLLVFMLLVDRFLLSVDPARIGVKRVTAEKFSIGQENLVVVTLSNPARSVLSGMLKDDIPETFLTSPLPRRAQLQSFRIPARGQTSVRYTVRPLSRGEFNFGKVHLRYHSALGLLWIIKKQPVETVVRVFPDLRRLRRMRVKYSRGQATGELHKRRLGAEGTRFDGLRTYVTGDDVRKMDWKATARMDTPVVRTFTHEVEQPVLVLLDAGRKMEAVTAGDLAKFDWALNAALAFAGVAVDRGDQVGVGVFSNRKIISPQFGSGKKHLKLILDTLCDVQPEPVEPDYEEMLLQFSRALKRRSLIVIFTDLIDPMASRSLIRGVRTFSKHHLLMIVTLSDAQLIEQSRSKPEDAYDAYKVGVTQDLLDIRRKALAELTRAHGAIVIDTPPEAMDESLIDHYMAVKLRNKL